MTDTAIFPRLCEVLVIDDDASIHGALDKKFTKAGSAVPLCQDGENSPKQKTFKLPS